MTDRIAALEARLAASFPDAWPPRLREACLYPIQTGGKRIRPLLCFAAAEALGREWRDATDAAVAIELVHTYSLVHDDLPCMDDDAERRGRPTVHVVYGEATVVLVGDALLTEAFRVVPPHLARVLAQAAGAAGMVAGQFVDIAGGVDTLDDLRRLHRAKTGALIRAAVRMGADGSDVLDTAADAIGLAFQVQDDVLDADQDSGDGPPSYVKLLGLDGARREAHRLADEALAALDAFPKADELRRIARFTVERDR